MPDRTAGRDLSLPHTTRRRALRGAGLVAVGALAGVAGCTTGGEEGPNPHVVWEETEPAIDAVTVQQTVDVTAMVANVGGPGRVEVTAETRAAGREEPLETASVTIEMADDDQRELSFEMEVSPAADLLEARAETA